MGPDLEKFDKWLKKKVWTNFAYNNFSVLLNPLKIPTSFCFQL